MTSNTRHNKLLLTWQHPHLALQQWSRAGCWQRRAHFANLPRCRWPPGTVEVSTMAVKIPQWGILCKNGRFAAWSRRKWIVINLPWRSPCISLQGLCLIAARFLLEQQQLWESHLYFAREQGYNMVSPRGSEQLYATMPSWVQHEKSQSAAWRAGSTSAEPYSLEAESEHGDDLEKTYLCAYTKREEIMNCYILL